MSESVAIPLGWLVNSRGEKIIIRGSCRLGRSHTCDVCLREDLKVSKRHAVIQQQEGRQFWLVDYGSTNGTYLNDHRLMHPTRLKPGDKFRVGTQLFEFQQAVDAARTEETDFLTRGTLGEIAPQTCWLLVADIIDSTALVQRLPPEELPVVTGRWLADCQQVIEDHGGRINQFMGDGYFAFWRHREALETDICRAVQALQQLEQKSKIDFRVVVHVGSVILGGMAVGEEEHISGAEVHFVFRIEKLAVSLGEHRLLSQASADRLGSLLTVKSVGQHPLKGFPSEYPFYSF